MARLTPGAFIEKGAIFADSPAVQDNSCYSPGINANVAYMSLPSVSEDGLMVSKSFVNKLKTRLYETRVFQFGSNCFALNIYGNYKEYKIMPEIGEFTREDGLIACTREYDTSLAPVEMSISDVLEPIADFDKMVYSRGGIGRVVDIEVVSNNNQMKNLPEEMSSQVMKYQKALLKFYQELLDTEENLIISRRKKFGTSKLKLTPALHNLLVTARAVVNHNASKLRKDLKLQYRKDPIDEFRVKIVIEYEISPREAFKLTDQEGSKGVICRIEEDENMPVDEHGNRADIVFDDVSVSNRMNPSRSYRHYMNSAARDVRKNVMSILGVSGKTTEDKLYGIDPILVTNAYNYLLGYYAKFSPKQHKFFSEIPDEEKYEHLKDLINDRIYNFFPIDNTVSLEDAVMSIETDPNYRPLHGPVSYVDTSGNRVTTVNKVRIAPQYIMLLDKIADDGSSVSFAKQQHFGTPSPVTKSEKFSTPHRGSPTRTMGETEGRIIVGYTGEQVVAEWIDRSNNPLTQRNMGWNIMSALHPTNIDHVVDRAHVSHGGSKPLVLTKHMLTCAGIELVYEPEVKK
jgi:hypothetical protein